MIEVKAGTETLSKVIADITKSIQLGAQQSVKDVSALIREEIITAIKEANAVASTDLMKSISSRVAQNRLSTGAFTTGFSATVGSNLSYASFVEEGMPSGRNVSTEEIFQWMIQKNGLEPSLIAASRIARKLREKGYQGKHVFKKGLERAEPQIQGIVDKDLQDQLNKV